ncbi:MAG: helix-turn-helix domain-containing protein [Candidatus Nanosalina sp.]
MAIRDSFEKFDSSGLDDPDSSISPGREYSTYQEAVDDLLENHDEESQIVEVFRALYEEERTAEELGEELGLERSHVSGSLSRLKNEGFVYMMGSQASDFYWGLDVEEIYGEDYVRLDD